ncbi:hypothetical protein OPV22_008520, partial [Ensete ventricosum]
YEHASKQIREENLREGDNSILTEGQSGAYYEATQVRKRCILGHWC